MSIFIYSYFFFSIAKMQIKSSMITISGSRININPYLMMALDELASLGEDEES